MTLSVAFSRDFFFFLIPTTEYKLERLYFVYVLSKEFILSLRNKGKFIWRYKRLNTVESFAISKVKLVLESLSRSMMNKYFKQKKIYIDRNIFPSVSFYKNVKRKAVYYVSIPKVYKSKIFLNIFISFSQHSIECTIILKNKDCQKM